MKRFTKAETEKERKKVYEERKKTLLDRGYNERIVDLSLSDILEDKGARFGLKNDFPRLKPEERKQVQEQLQLRYELLEKFQELRLKLAPLLAEEEDLRSKIAETNASICKLEGHRLSKTVETEDERGGYSQNPPKYYRTCLICGQRVYERNLRAKDVVVKGMTDLPQEITESKITLKLK